MFNWLIAIRLVMPYLGIERYGVVATVSSLGTFAALADIGLGQAVVNIAARAAARSEKESEYLVRATACSFWGLALLTSVLMVIVAGCAIVGRFAWPNGQVPAVFNGILVLAACMLLMQPFSVATKLLTGFQQYRQMYGWQLLGILGALICVWVASSLQLNELWIIGALFLPVALAQIGNTVHMFYFEYPFLAPKISSFQWDEAKQLVASGMTPFLSGASSSVIFTAPTWCMAALFGTGLAGSYSVLFRLMSPLVILCGMMTTPMWPAYAQKLALSQFEEMKRMLRLSLGLVLALNVAGLGLIAVILPRALAMLTKGMITSLPIAQVVATGALMVLMASRHTLMMAVLGSARGAAMRWVFVFGMVLSLGLPVAHGMLSQPYEVIIVFMGLEVALIAAATYDLAGLHKTAAVPLATASA